MQERKDGMARYKIKGTVNMEIPGADEGIRNK